MFLSLDHEGFITALCARSRLDLLKPLELELLTGLGLRNLAANGIVCVDLSIGGADGDEAGLLLFLLLLGDSETLLQVHLCLVRKLIHDDVVDGGLRSECATKSAILYLEW